MIGIAVERALIESFALGGLVRSAMLLFVAALSPVICAAALARRLPIPPLARVVGRAAQRTQDRMQLALGLMLAAVIVVCVQAALGLVFDPRYRDFPAAALTGAVVPFAVLMIGRAREIGARQPAETLTAVLLAVSAVYIVFNETLANWQALWTCAAFVLLAVILQRARGARG
jgi:hypothetical protein